MSYPPAVNVQDIYRQELKRIAWRLQYRAKVEKRRELPSAVDQINDSEPPFTLELFSKLMVVELLNQLKTPKERFILKKIIIEGYTEHEIAKQMDITQQAVNKWKRKAINTLQMKVLS